MRIPDELEAKIENEINNIKLTDLRGIAKILSARYMNAKRTGQSLLNKNLEVLAYSIIRMPATFGAINKALEETLDIYNPTIKTVLDNWYKTNIVDKNLEQYIADSGFCNDRSIYSGGDGVSTTVFLTSF